MPGVSLWRKYSAVPWRMSRRNAEFSGGMQFCGTSTKTAENLRQNDRANLHKNPGDLYTGQKIKNGPGKPADFPEPVGRNFSWMEGAPPAGAPVIPDCRSGSSRRQARPAGRSRTAGCGGQGQPFWLRLWRPFRPPRRQSRPRHRSRWQFSVFHHRRALLRPAGRAGARRRTRSRTAQGLLCKGAHTAPKFASGRATSGRMPRPHCLAASAAMRL